MTIEEWIMFGLYWQYVGLRQRSTVYRFDQWFPDFPGDKPALPMDDLKSIGLVRVFLN